MSLAGSLGDAQGLAAAPASTLSVSVFDSWAAAEPRWERLSDGPDTLPFQRAAWLRPWYRHHAGAGCSPHIMFVSQSGSAADMLGLALVRRTHGRLRVLTFADEGLTDYNAPALGSTSAIEVDPRKLWRALRAGLPPADRLVFSKMPVRIGERPNPLADLPGVQSMHLSGNVLPVPGAWEAWRKSLERTFRKELGRSGRVFDRIPGATFRCHVAGSEAIRVYHDLERLQAARIAELGLPYSLEAEPAKSFYASIADEGLRDGTAILTALSVGEETVAALLGITDGHHYAMTRLATPGPQWKHVSPGRLLITRTLHMLHVAGFRSFDFTIGDYPYKRRLGVETLPLVQLDAALSWRALPASLAARGRVAASQTPALKALADRARALRKPGRPAA